MRNAPATKIFMRETGNARPYALKALE